MQPNPKRMGATLLALKLGEANHQAALKDQGLRIGRESILLASASCAKRSALGSHFSFRPSRIEMLARWQTVETRWPISTGKYGSFRLFTHLRKSSCSPSGLV